MKKVILVYPRTGADAKIPQPPYSLLVLSPFLEEKGYEVVLVDDRVEDAERKLKEHLDGAICVGISSMTGFQLHHARRLASFIKSQNKNIPLVWGGVHSTFLPKQTIKDELVDIIVRGEGELILPELVQCLDSKKDMKNIPNLVYKDKDDVIETKTELKLVNLDDKIKMPWHLVNIHRYIRPDFGAQRTITLVTSRGCPHRCGFCYNINFNKSRWRGKKAEQVVDGIKHLQDNYGIDGIDFSEDNFFANRKRVLEICQLLVDRKINIAISASCRVDYLSRYSIEELRLMKRAGLKQLFFGIESGSERILKLIQKDITIEQVKESLRKCKEAGIVSRFTFVTGFPTETKQDINKTLDLMDYLVRYNKKNFILGLFSYMVFPGTPLYDFSVKQGFKVPSSMQEWSQYSFATASDKLGWLSNKEIRRLKTLFFISRVIFYDKKIKTNLKTSQAMVFDALRFIGKLRWKYRFFSFPVEWILVGKYFEKLSLN